LIGASKAAKCDFKPPRRVVRTKLNSSKDGKIDQGKDKVNSARRNPSGILRVAKNNNFFSRRRLTNGAKTLNRIFAKLGSSAGQTSSSVCSRFGQGKEVGAITLFIKPNSNFDFFIRMLKKETLAPAQTFHPKKQCLYPVSKKLNPLSIH